MGVEDRDWYRETEQRLGTSVGLPGVALVAAILAGVVVAALLLWRSEGDPARYAGTSHTRAGDVKISILPGLPGITIHGDPLYAKDDPWRAYLADERTCPGGERHDAPLQEQAQTMVCLVNFARERRGLEPVTTVALLNRTSILKAEKIVRCRDFDHSACGTDPAADATAAGYLGAWGENLYIAGGRFGSPRVAMDGWLNSRGHRENLFRPEWRTQGIAVQRLARFGRDRDMTLWVNQFGTS